MQPRKSAAEEFDSIHAMSPEDALDAIQDVVEDVDQYVLEWFKRLNDGLAVADAPSAATTDRELRARIKDFREEKRQWEAKRKVEQHELQEKMRQLTGAWLRLEDEQRLLLQRRESTGSNKEKPTTRNSGRPEQNSAPAYGTEDAAFQDQQRAAVQSESNAPSVNDSIASPTRPRPTGSDRDVSPSASKAITPNDAAVRQFQQLRREIETSRSQPDLG